MAGQSGAIVGKINVSIRESVQKKAINAALKKLDKKIDKIKQIAIKEAENVIEKYLLQNVTIKALQGKLSEFEEGADLQSEFGLKPAMAQKAVEAIIEILKDTVVVDIDRKNFTRGVGAKLSIKITALVTRRYRQKLLGYGYPLTYVSQFFVSQARKRGARRADTRIYRPKHNIDWIRWLLDADRGIKVIEDSIPDISKYGITYKNDIVEGSHSRSGRAIMVRGLERSGSKISVGGHFGAGGRLIGIEPPASWKGVEHFPYQFPKRAMPENGAKNFIEEISNRPQFAKDIKSYVTRALQEFLEVIQ